MVSKLSIREKITRGTARQITSGLFPRLEAWRRLLSESKFVPLAEVWLSFSGLREHRLERQFL